MNMHVLNYCTQYITFVRAGYVHNALNSYCVSMQEIIEDSIKVINVLSSKFNLLF